MDWQILNVDANRVGDTWNPPSGQCGLLIIIWDGDRPIGRQVIEPGGKVPTLEELNSRAVSLLADAGDHGGSAACPCSPPPSTTVIICTRDRPADLARCLDSVESQTLAPDEVIVVDNASSTVATKDVSKGRAGVRYIYEPRAGLDIARNTGIAHARGDILAWCDDDVLLNRRWLEQIVRAFDSPRIMAVTGPVLPAELATEAQRLFEFRWGFDRGYMRIDYGPEFFAKTVRHGCPAADIGAGASMAFRRQAFDHVGWFDERLDVGAAGCNGDSEMWYRLVAEGWICRYDPTVVAFHFHRRTRIELEQQIRAYLRGYVTATLIQFEKYGHAGNLRRLFITLPRFYVRRWLSRLRHGETLDNAVLSSEVRGYLAGLLYYCLHRRDPALQAHLLERETVD